jgi:pimeloyl-ACP methyl ester carboxylesterase
VATGSGYQDAADNVARYIAERDLRDIVLVGHSGGGIAISKQVELIADRAKRLVYLAMAANKSREFAGTIPRMDSPSLRTQPLRGTVILRDQRKGNAAYVAVPSLEKSIRRKPLVRHQGRIARIM